MFNRLGDERRVGVRVAARIGRRRGKQGSGETVRAGEGRVQAVRRTAAARGPAVVREAARLSSRPAGG